jgi:hypothetical protein
VGRARAVREQRQFENSGSSLVSGQLNGAIRETDLTNVVIPAIATQFNLTAHTTPCAGVCLTLLQIFDTGGAPDPTCGVTDAGAATSCRNPDNTCAKGRDGIISICEVATNGLMKNVLAPDVALFDANGNWHPDPTNTKRDSLSVGFGFTAVRASF